MSRLKSRWILLSLLFLPSCSFIHDANDFKARGRIDLLFPFDLIPGLSSVLPHIVLDLSGGFEWHNDEAARQHELDLIKLKNQIGEENEIDIEELMLSVLRGESS